MLLRYTIMRKYIVSAIKREKILLSFVASFSSFSLAKSPPRALQITADK